MGKSFNIVLNSTDTTSYTGVKHNANYFVDFKSLIPQTEWKKKYNITVRMKSKYITTLPITNNVYLFHLNLGTLHKSQQNKTFTSVAVILNRIEEEPTVLATGVNNNFYFNHFSSDSSPLQIESINETTSIQLKITTEDMTTLYSTMPDYVFVLNFEECY